MSAHTPAPWKNEGTGLITADGDVVADFVRPEDRALIAAAPELLAALKRAVETIRAWHNMGHYAGEADHVWTLYQQSPEMQQINAALAKTEGRS